MPVELMGKPVDMDAFRERQAERPAAVPRDIERRNAASVQRSREAQYDTDRAGDAGVPASVRDVLSTPGQPLDGGIQRAMEERMGDSLGDVRVHTGATAARACEDINARAFTVGNHIAFNHGEYDPESPAGQHLLAHELAHVRQQTGAAISMMPQEDSGLEIDPDPRLEREAEDAAQQAMADGPVTINRLGTAVQIQRLPEAEQLEQARQQASDRFGSADETSVPADPEVLATEVERLKSNQAEMMAAFVEARPGAADSSPDVAGAVGKGLAGGVTGALVGSVLGPGGTVAGFAVGLTSSVATDVSKESMDWLMDNSPGSSALELEARIESLEERLAELRDEQYSHERLKGVANSRGD
ncbi:transposase [Natrinema limicola JCM 13563]|uniref:Transposase n=2 Tax=Natrinema limicola TaxID=370323 RepID=M0CTV5_9EURY|nr:transposase [Natrinema limicola JCM 13563]